MYAFEINGEMHTTAEDVGLLEYLRESLGLTSAKNGCGEGACGACMVLIDGKATRACLARTSALRGKKILTVEGLSRREQDVCSWAFSAAGAVQCGFCIPGMVMSAKGLLDVTPDPTEAQIRGAIRGNLCRCTGYTKIVRAIEMAARGLRDPSFTPPDPWDRPWRLGERMPRVDAPDKVLGRALFSGDIRMPGMLFGAALRSPAPRVKIRKIDTSEAEKHPGVVAVLTAKDIPGERYQGHIVHDWPVLVAEGEETRYIGDALALVAATDRKATREALKLIRVDCEALKPVFTVRESLNQEASGADGYRIHPFGNRVRVDATVRRGDADSALANSAHVVRREYVTPAVDHAFLEPETALSYFDSEGTLIVRTGGQSVYDELREISGMLGVAADSGKVRVITAAVGGGFGGKEDLSVQHHAALLAWRTKRPVRVTLTRQESLLCHPKRHPMFMDYTVGCDAEGRITAMRIRIRADTGAYTSLGGPVLQRACTHATGPYRVPSVDIEGTGVYTNNPPSGAFRGFGVAQSAFAVESTLNLLAEKVGISYWEIRDRNAVEPGDVLGNGQIAQENTAIRECLARMKPVFESSPLSGIACAWKNSGIGVGLPDTGRVRLEVKNGGIGIFTSAACMGQGIASTMTQIASHTTGLPVSKIAFCPADTKLTPDSETSTASRQTLFTGEATRRVCARFVKALDEAGGDIASLDGRSFHDEFLYVTDPMGSDKPNPVSHAAYSFAVQVCILNGEGRVEKFVACHDVGQPINLNNVEGQIEGGVVMGMGYALTEDLRLRDGIPRAKYGTLGLFRAPDVPPIECVVMDRKGGDGAGAFGAKGSGEIVLVPTAPALALAYRRLDGKFRTSLPLADTPYARKQEKE
ncbi:MAG: selenium-dependent xanthine dehydrogenase [Synergistaceae bacterium]|jgi:selenium-dependent xanthine dehydrogenase|nr:selenium-dependent xanthine dehydrogenase [Synergistaceae bacterium]